MQCKVKYDNFFAYSYDEKKCFNAKFGENINIVYGKNTSGKSTFLQCILYTFGINDEKRKLQELLDKKVIFRLDFSLHKNEVEKVTIVRDDEIISIKVGDGKKVKFIGIGGDKSSEHIKLKKYLSELFEFNLYLEYEGEYKQAPLEAMFLPYYIAQDVGWVYRHKSFRGLDFVRNFKNDFFDYYLGISDSFDRIERTKLVNERKAISSEVKLLIQINENSQNIKLASMKDESFIEVSRSYIESYISNKSELVRLEKDYIIKCNELARLNERRNILNKVKRSLEKEKDLVASENCPTCHQSLNFSLEDKYSHFQNINDTYNQLAEVKKNMNDLKKSQGIINTLSKKIEEKSTTVANDYYDLLDYNVDDLNFQSWLNNKVSVNFSREIIKKIESSNCKLNAIDEKLSNFKTDEIVTDERIASSRMFKKIFERYVSDLNVKHFGDERFYLLYHIPAFPRQGVELLKTLLAYNFSFLNMIKLTEYVHIFPLILDAIFEGDLEDESRHEILKFISQHIDIDQQVVFSIADSKKNIVSVEYYNNEYFNGKANLICIGGNVSSRSLLNESVDIYRDFLIETYGLLE